MDSPRSNHACGIFESYYHSGRPLLVVADPSMNNLLKKQLCPDHVISTGRQMTNLVSNFEYLLLLSLLTTTKF